MICDDPAMAHARDKELRIFALILTFLLVLNPCSPVLELLRVRICSLLHISLILNLRDLVQHRGTIPNATHRIRRDLKRHR